MSSSDWLQIVLSLMGFIVGAGISWVFFRAQQKTDFTALRDAIQTLRNQEIRNIDKNLAIIRKANDVATYVRLQEEISGLRGSMHKLNADVNVLPQRIISDFRAEQHTFLERVSDKFNEKVSASQIVLEEHLRRELKNFLPTANQQDKLVERMSELVKYALISMGKYQLEVVASESEDALTRTEKKVNSAVIPVTKKLEGVDRQVELLSALPQPRNTQK